MTAPLTLCSVLTFGKYEGLSVDIVIKVNPRYLLWMRKHKGLLLDGPTTDAAVAAYRLDEHNTMCRQDAWARGQGLWAKNDREKTDRRRIKIEHDARHAAGQTGEYDMIKRDFKWTLPEKVSQ